MRTMKAKRTSESDRETIGEWAFFIRGDELWRSHVSRPESDEFVTAARKPAEFALRMLRLKEGLPEYRQ
jgi:hypothetical protein